MRYTGSPTRPRALARLLMMKRSVGSRACARRSRPSRWRTSARTGSAGSAARASGAIAGVTDATLAAMEGLGASRAMAILRVTLPLSLPAVAEGVALSLAASCKPRGSRLSMPWRYKRGCVVA